MSERSVVWVAAALLCALCWGLLGYWLFSPKARVAPPVDQHEGEASWAIQGLYSQPGCKNQPGTYPFYIEAGGAEFFLECRIPEVN